MFYLLKMRLYQYINVSFLIINTSFIHFVQLPIFIIVTIIVKKPMLNENPTLIRYLVCIPQIKWFEIKVH